MVAKLSVQIALEGAKEIERQLADISKAGQKAFNDINKAAGQAGGFDKLDAGVIEKKLAGAKLAADELVKVKKLLADTASLERLAQALSLVDKQFSSIGLSAKALLLVLGPLEAIITVLAVALGAGFVTAVLKSADAIKDLDAQAIKIGATITQLDRLRQSFESAGISTGAITQGMAAFKTELDRINLAKVQKAFEEAQKNIAAGWPAGTRQLEILRKAADDVGPAADAARAALATLGQPFQDNVTPAFESMVKWAGSATKAIPLIAGEMERLRTSGERARFITLVLEEIAAEAGTVPEKMENVVRALERMPNSVQRNNAALKIFGDVLGTEVVQALNVGGIAVDQFIAKRKLLTQLEAENATKTALAWNKVMAAIHRVLDTPLNGTAVTTVLDAIVAAIDRLQKYIENFSWSTFIADAAAAIPALLNPFTSLAAQIGLVFGQGVWDGFVQGASAAAAAAGQYFSQLATDIVGWFARLPGNVWDQFVSDAKQAVDMVAGYFGDLKRRILETLGLAGGGGAGAPQGPGFAGGGMVGGRGTGTSDSNLAWLSRGEHVMPARAVRQPGVLALLEALRRSGGNLAGVMDRIGGFALGGLVGPMAVPAFAGGGGVNSMSHVTIAFPGLPAIGGLRAPGSVVDELRRAAGMAQVRSGGRKPSRYS